MGEPAIHVEKLSKQYRIGARQPGYRTFRETLMDAAMAPFQRLSKLKSRKNLENANTIWALKDVTFEVKQGEVVGIIGRNGAGKSTLLKVLSKITEPTKGRVRMYGRVGSLLEVGTGFHPELTGHENVYLYGAILGMDRWEVTRKFDEIVEFAELEQFIDTPVKRYSSGMYMRLAFAVAAHMETEILMVDEVLAVGDAAFQNKCIGKMGSVSKEGRTVLFVSHNMGAIGQLCDRCLLLEGGGLGMDGDVERVIYHYSNAEAQMGGGRGNEITGRSGSGRIRMTSVKLMDIQDQERSSYHMGETIKLIIHGESFDDDIEFSLGVIIADLTGMPILYMYDQFQIFKVIANENFTITSAIEELPLMPGGYLLDLWFGRSGLEEYDYIKSAARLEVVQSDWMPVTLSVHQKHGLVYKKLVARQLS